jgi:hypothetical protein
LNLRALFGLCALGLVKGDMELAQNATTELVNIPPDLLSKAGLEGDVELVLSKLFLIQVGGRFLIAMHFVAKSWNFINT